MSKVGKQPIDIPNSVEVKIDGKKIDVKGPKGSLDIKLPRLVEAQVKDDQIIVTVKKDSDKAKALHGTYRSHVANMVHGVTDGWTKKLEMVGTGYRAEVTGNTLVLTVGYSHPVEMDIPEGINAKVEKLDITLDGIDKESVGQFAASIRSVRPPEPYKGKGIRYKDEVVRRKPGKAAKAQAA